jgi:hypothetical protein
MQGRCTVTTLFGGPSGPYHPSCVVVTAKSVPACTALHQYARGGRAAAAGDPLKWLCDALLGLKLTGVVAAGVRRLQIHEMDDACGVGRERSWDTLSI